MRECGGACCALAAMLPAVQASRKIAARSNFRRFVVEPVLSWFIIANPLR
jgi:sorbitol-specific phosphotransferase system component IIC